MKLLVLPKGEDVGGAGGGGGGTSGGGGTGGGDISAILAYLYHWNFGKDGDFTGNAGYYGDNTGPVGSKEPEKDENWANDLLDSVTAVPDKTLQPPSRETGQEGDLWRREIEPYTGLPAAKKSLFAFVGVDVDVYSGRPMVMENPDPFTGLPASDPFVDADWPTRARGAERFATRRPTSLLSSPYLLADNDVIACDPNRASCPPNVKSDFNQSSLANLVQAEMDESNAAMQALAEGKSKIIGDTEEDIQKVVSKAAQAARSDEYTLAYTVNQLRHYPLEIRHSAVLTGLGHMAFGGVTMVGSGLIIYGTGGLALPLIGATGFGAGTAETISGLTLAFSGADSMETVRMSGQLDYVFALTKSPTSLIFGTTGLVLSNGDVNVSHRFAVVGGIAEDLATFRGDPSKLYSAVIPSVGTKAEKGASALLVKDVAALGSTAHAESIETVAAKLTGQSGLINPRAGEELFVGDWLNQNLQVKLDNTVKSFVADPRTMAALVPPNIPYKAIPQFGGFVVEYGQKAALEGEWILNSALRRVPQSAQMVRGGAPDLVLRSPFANWNLKGWDITTVRSAAAKEARGVDYTFLTYTVDWKALGL